MNAENTNSKKLGLLVFLVVVLIAVIAFQGWHMIRLNQKVDQLADQRTRIALNAFQQPAPAAPPSSPPAPASQPNLPNSSILSATPSWPRIQSPDPFPFSFDPDTWDPFDEMNRMQSRMDQIFQDAFGRFRNSKHFQGLVDNPVFSPHVDIQDTDDSYVVRFDMPGMDQSKIDVQVKDQQLIVSGKNDEFKKEEKGEMLQQERRIGSFERSLSLPGPVNSNKMKVEYDKGVLVVTLPKAAQAS